MDETHDAGLPAEHAAEKAPVDGEETTAAAPAPEATVLNRQEPVAGASADGAEGAPPTREEPAPDAPAPEPPARAPAPAREVEAKFKVRDPGALAALRAAPGLSDHYRLGVGRARHVHDTYLDTPDFAVLRSGFALRVRAAGDRSVVTFKGLERTGYGPIHDRVEIEGAIAAGAEATDLSAWPDPIRYTVLGLAGPVPALAPYCVLRQVRHERAVIALTDNAAGAEGSGHAVGLLSMDEVVIHDPALPGTEEDGPVAVAGFSEVEFEVAPHYVASDLGPVADLLAERAGLSAAGGSKLERALGHIADHTPGADPETQGIQSAMAMPEAGRLVWRHQLAEILLNEAGARRGDDIEYVHDMRVATRRARAAARLFGRYFDKKTVRRANRGLRTTGRKLGDVRDLDVALDKLGKYAADRSEAEQAGLAELADAWTQQRDVAYERLLGWLDSEDYRRFVASFAELVRTPGAGARTFEGKPGTSPVPHEVRHVMPGAVLGRFEQVRAYEPLLSGQSDVPEATLHALRIDCKRLRYSLEPVRHLMGDDGRQLVKQLRKLQDHLGDLNDAAVTRDRLAAMRGAGVDNDAIGHYIDVQHGIIEYLRASFPAVWDRFIASKNRGRLMLAIAQL